MNIIPSDVHVDGPVTFSRTQQRSTSLSTDAKWLTLASPKAFDATHRRPGSGGEVAWAALVGNPRDFFTQRTTRA